MFTILFILLIVVAVSPDDVAKEAARPVVLPVPLDLPNRNDRADQCWLRVEEVELTQTMATLCHISNSFLKNHIRDYNARKLTDDGVELTLVTEASKVTDEVLVPYAGFNGQRTVKDWRTTTFLDPTTHNRVYVTAKADCRLLMYSRDAITNYKVNCEKFLYYLNEKLKSDSVTLRALPYTVSVMGFLIFLF